MTQCLKVKEFDSLSLRWLASEKASKMSNHTIRAYDLARRKLRDYMNESEDPAAEITPLLIQAWKEELVDSGVSNNTISHYMGTINRFFAWAKRMKIVAESPVFEEDIPKIKESKPQYIPTKEEINKLINYRPHILTSLKPIRNRAIIVLAIMTGMRSDELRSLTISDLNFEEEYINIRNGKGGKARRAPFPQKAMNAVRDYLRSGLRPSYCTDEDYLFGSTDEPDEVKADLFGNPIKINSNETNDTINDEEKKGNWHKMNPSVLGRIVKSYGKKVIGKDIHPHTLRHCATSLWIDYNVPMRDVQNALGHQSIVTTEKVYAHILNKNKAAEAVNKALNEI